MKVVWTGLESSGKSLLLSARSEDVRVRNAKYVKRGIKPRIMAFNTPMSTDFQHSVTASGVRYATYDSWDTLMRLGEGIDIFCDELLKLVPQKGSDPLPLDVLDYITQCSKRGIHMYCASQDFSQVHKQFRLLVNEVFIVTKVIGSRRPMKSAPPVKNIWGLCIVRQVEPASFKGDSVTMKSIGFPWPFFIRERDTRRFDTSFKIELTRLPVKKLRKQIEECDEDGFKRVKYI